jgi:heme-degrading monooxygenase HmoA
VAKWRNLQEHRRAQALGRSRFFTSYRLVMAQALRDYTHDRRDQIPTDSR